MKTQSQGIFDTAELEKEIFRIIEEGKFMSKENPEYDIFAGLGSFKTKYRKRLKELEENLKKLPILRKVLKERQRLKAEVEKILNEKYDEVAMGYPNYPEHFNKDNPRLKLIQELKARLGISQAKQGAGK